MPCCLVFKELTEMVAIVLRTVQNTVKRVRNKNGQVPAQGLELLFFFSFYQNAERKG